MAHATLSPSAAYRWFRCPGSIRATAGLPDDSNEYAREGTAAHTLAERCLSTGTDAAKWVGTYEGRIRVDYDGGAKYQFFTVDRDMAEAVQVYLDHVRALGSEPNARVLVEQTVRLEAIDPALAPVWGTADCIVYVPGTRTLYVVDYKHGRGKVVDATDNLQLKIYALAAWATFGDQFKPLRIVATIVQPRAGGEPIRSAEYTAAELFDFIADVQEAVQRTDAPDAPLVPGSHCDFCRVRATCPALSHQAVAVAQDEFALVPPQQLTIEQCVAILEKAELLEDWIKGVREHLHARALEGHPIPGHKLVPKRATRQWALPEKDVAARLAPLVAVEDELYRKELLSPAQMEKVVGKARLPADLVVSLSSGYNLVKDTDARPAVTIHPGDDFASLPPP